MHQVLGMHEDILLVKSILSEMHACHKGAKCTGRSFERTSGVV